MLNKLNYWENKLKISIVLPAKNESGAIGETVKKILQLGIIDELIVINDGSTDNTKNIAEQAGAKVISHPYSKGNGAAIKTGARNATGDIIVFMDADGQHDPNDIKKLIEKIEQGYDLVVGARQKGSQASIGRGIANHLYNNIATYMTEHKVEDLTSGFRAVRAEKFREFLYLLPNGFSYPTTSTMAFFRAGYSVTYIPIHAAKRIGKSHIQPLKDGMRFFIIIFKIATLFSPLKMFIPIAVMLFMMATAWYGYTLYEYHRFTNMSALLYTGSVMIFLMGLISEQITALMYKEK
ncbi:MULTISPECIES: glycosyltransferase family 2 protein [Acinetobacter]|uniref:glycosyltransferase family 2 protein n=1 Tax=Acinetobacter TaxID=469 RepID=UPI000EA33CC3|nr:MULTISPECIES: glycosyltransferase family 2 protein [Acinetobacter]RKG46094.1 glycosyltransferase family 2 protein [Acinetobacter cumulans]RZG61266.1 glycosyltransferase family 2 protein [Acinetobacter sp. WCHAc060006]